MKTFLKTLAVIAFVATAAFVARSLPVAAAPIFSATLTSSDAGASQTVLVTAQANYCLQCPYPLTCYKLELWDGGSHTADCSKDFVVNADGFNAVAPIPSQQNPYSSCFQTAARTALVASQLDGGPVSCRLLFNEQNKPR